MSPLWSLFRKGFGGYRLPIPTPTSSAFRSSFVCTRWLSSSSSSSSSSVTTKVPWLILPPAENGTFLPVFNPSDRRFYKFTLPDEVQGPEIEIHGSGHGWLVMATNRSIEDMAEDEDPFPVNIRTYPRMAPDKDVFLYNPLTRDHILLPLLPYYFYGHCVSSAQIICDPTTASPGQPILAIIQGFNQILIYRQGDYGWAHKIINPPDVNRILRIVYHQPEDKIYVLYDDYARLAVLDFASPFELPPEGLRENEAYSELEDYYEENEDDLVWRKSQEYFELVNSLYYKECEEIYCPLQTIIDTPSSEIESLNGLKHLVSAAGDLLLVVGQDWPCSDERPQYDVFKLDRSGEEGCYKWVRAANISNHTLFACRNHVVVSMVCDPEFTDARANQIYHFKQRSKYHRYVGSPDNNNNIAKIPADVRVWDIIDGANSGDEGQLLSFTTSKILRQMSSTWNTHYAAWMVPSLDLKDSLDDLNSDSS